MFKEKDISSQNEEGFAAKIKKAREAKDSDIKKYKDLEGVTLSKLNFGLWYAEHKGRLRTALISFLAVISAISWSYTIYGFAYYVGKGLVDDDLMVREITRQNLIGHDYILQISAKDLVYQSVRILEPLKGRYDFYAYATNPNDDYWAEFDYYFLVNGQERGRAGGFILPNESKYLLALSEELDSKPASAQIITDNFSWHRINKHIIPDFNDWKSERFNFLVSGAELKPSNLSGLSEKISLSQLKFAAKNESAYSYIDVDFVILIYSGTNVVGINKYRLNDFMSGQVREVIISWPGSFGPASKVEVLPELNLFDNGNYIKIGGGPGAGK